jgi:hypothetical protein
MDDRWKRRPWPSVIANKSWQSQATGLPSAVLERHLGEEFDLPAAPIAEVRNCAMMVLVVVLLRKNQRVLEPGENPVFRVIGTSDEVCELLKAVALGYVRGSSHNIPLFVSFVSLRPQRTGGRPTR